MADQGDERDARHPEPAAAAAGAGASVGRVASNQAGHRAAGRTGPFQFLRECREELRRVQWPSADQVAQATAVVLIVSVVVGTYLWGLDQVFSRAASWLIRQQAS